MQPVKVARPLGSGRLLDLEQIHRPLALAGTKFGVQQAAQGLRPPVPGPVNAVSAALPVRPDFRGYGIPVAGDIAAGVPAPVFPGIGGAGVGQVLIGAAAISPATCPTLINRLV